MVDACTLLLHKAGASERARERERERERESGWEVGVERGSIGSNVQHFDSPRTNTFKFNVASRTQRPYYNKDY